jgi:hypothetical protein
MKKSLLKISLSFGLLCGGLINSAEAQIQPLSFGIAGTNTASNWYADYVGSRFIVLTPSTVAGEKQHSGFGSPAVGWPNIFPHPINNARMRMAGPDSSCVTPDTVDFLTTDVAMVYRGINEFGVKAFNVQNHRAIACVIVNNQNNGVIGMSGGMDSTLVTIPVYMITKSDGDAIRTRMELGDTVRITIQNWGNGYADDLGIIVNGESRWHDYAIPNHELSSTNGNPLPYKLVDGAFVANFGTANETNVRLSTTVQFTPTGGSPSVVHTDTTSAVNFPAIDSILVMYAPWADVHASGNGRFDVTYNVTEANTDEFPADNTLSYSFYTTDSIYSKGAYDFVNQKPLCADYYGGLTTPSLLGPLYYIQSGGYYAGFTQFSMQSTTVGTHFSIPMYIYLWEWTDTSSPVALDTLMEKGELKKIGYASKIFSPSNPGDTSGGTWTVEFNDGAGNHPTLKANTWYWVSAEVPGSTSLTYYMGVDGQSNYYPRSYGVYRFENYKESSAAEYGSGGYASFVGVTANTVLPPFTYDNIPYSYDSILFAHQKLGLTPSIALMTTTNQSVYGLGVKQIAEKDLKVDIFPNPATDKVNVTVSLPSVAKSVSYHVVSSDGRVIAIVEHKNVQNDKYSLATSKLPAGMYYMTIGIDGSTVSRKFVVAGK